MQEEILLNETYAIMMEIGEKKMYYQNNKKFPAMIWTEDITKLQTFDIIPFAFFHSLCEWHPKKDIKIVKVRNLSGLTPSQKTKKELEKICEKANEVVKKSCPRPSRTDHTKPPSPSDGLLWGMSDRSFQQLEACHRRYNEVEKDPKEHTNG